MLLVVLQMVLTLLLLLREFLEEVMVVQLQEQINLVILHMLEVMVDLV